MLKIRQLTAAMGFSFTMHSTTFFWLTTLKINFFLYIDGIAAEKIIELKIAGAG